MGRILTELTETQILSGLRAVNAHRNYWLMYSSLFGGYVRDPALMILPIDDHMVHRGDGIFEALRFHGHKLFELEGHISRLFRSADAIAMQMPKTREQIENLCKEIVESSPQADGMLRIFVSRGYGDFSANPYSTKGSQIYLITMPFKKMAAEKYEQGVSAVFSSVPVKPGFFAQVKSCNYLPNVLTKKESVDRGVDFAVNLTPDGYVAEGPTENIMVLTKDHELVAPPFDYTLRGTTLLRVLEIARRHASQLGLREVGTSPLKKQSFYEALEVMFVGTTLGVLPLTQLDGRAVGSAASGSDRGIVGPVARALNAYLEHEMGM